MHNPDLLRIAEENEFPLSLLAPSLTWHSNLSCSCSVVYAPEPYSPLSLPTSQPHSLNLSNVFPHFFKPSSLDSLPRSSFHSPSTRTPQELFQLKPSFSNRNSRSTRIRYRFPSLLFLPSSTNSLLFTLRTQVNLI